MPQTKFKGENINKGTPKSASIAFKLEYVDHWIVGVEDGGYLKMMKIHVVNENSFDWISSKTNRGYSACCASNKCFAVDCFVGTDRAKEYYGLEINAYRKGNQIS